MVITFNKKVVTIEIKVMTIGFHGNHLVHKSIYHQLQGDYC